MDQLVTILSTSKDVVNEAEVVAYSTEFIDRLFPDWSYAANASNQSKFGSYTLALATVLSLRTFPQELAAGLARKILQEDMKSIYRALTVLRQGQTIPVLNLLQQIAKLVPQDLYTSFDFTLRAIPKMLSQQPYRHAFLMFYMELIASAAPQTRRDLFANRKVYSGWIGKLGMDDDEEIISKTIELLHKYVLKDTTVFTKTTKMGLFNDWTLKNMQRMLSASALPSSLITEALTEQLSRFLVVLFCDRTLGVRMPGENRLALSFLKIVKPWENVAEMDLVVRLLLELPDLYCAYFETLSSAYTLAPKQSMFWFSFAVLHIRALKLPLSKAVLTAPKLDLASSYVLPRTITKSALLQSLQFDSSSLVKFEAAQIVLFAMRRLLSAINSIYAPAKWDAESLIDDVLQRLPEVNKFAKPVEPPLLRTTYLLIVKTACELRPISLNIPMPLDAEVRGLDLVEAETVLEIQTYTSDQTKWWSPSKDRLSLFTQLVKFATFNVELAGKSSELLQRLTQPTQLFADMPTLAHPVDALLFSLSAHNSPVVWEVIDQAVLRAVRSPYQYIDAVRSEIVSPFVVALIEQYEHHRKLTANADWTQAEQWLGLFIRALVVLGEDREILQKLSPVGPQKDDSDEYFNFVLDAPDGAILGRADLVFKISNQLELAATLFRVVESSNAKVQNHLLASIPVDMHDLMVSSPAAFKPFISEPHLCRAFLATVEKSSTELTLALEKGENWSLGLPFLSTSFLVDKLNEGALNVLPELNSRQYQLDASTIHSVLNSDLAANSEILYGLAKNLELWEPKCFDGSEALDIMMRINNSPHFVASLVRISGRYPQKHPLAFAAPVLVAGARYAQQDLDIPVVLEHAEQLLRQGDASSLAIMAELMAHITANSSVWSLLADYIEKCKQTSRSVLDSDLLRLCLPKAPFLGRYLKIAVHQLTKQFAEKTFESANFLNEFTFTALKQVNLWDYVHHNAINALLEAALRFETQEQVAVYQLVSVISSFKSPTQTTLSHLTTLFETRKPALAGLEEAIVIYFLFNKDSDATEEIEQAVLQRYSGTLAPKDLILFSILRQIEAVRQRSWMENMQSLDVRPASQTDIVEDYGADPLVVVRGGGLFVTFDEQMVRTSIQTYEPALACDFTDGSYTDLKTTIEKYEIRAPQGLRYDSRFLLDFVVSAQYLYDNLEIFLSSGLISFVICTLVSGDLRDTSLKVLKFVFSKLPDAQFKDQVGLRLLLGKLLLLESKQEIPSHLPGMLGQIALVLTKPSHFLHDKVTQWLLASPQIHESEIPLFKAVCESSTDMKMRELVWIVNTLKSGCVDRSAVQLCIRFGVVEWLLVQLELLSPRAAALKESINRLLNRIEELDGASSLLVQRNGAFAVEALQERLFYTAGPKSVTSWTL